MYPHSLKFSAVIPEGSIQTEISICSVLLLDVHNIRVQYSLLPVVKVIEFSYIMARFLQHNLKSRIMEHRITRTLSILFIIAWTLFLSTGSSYTRESAYQFSNDEKLSVYPNPVKDRLMIEFHSESKVLPVIQVIDLTGKMVLKYEGRLIYVQKLYKAELDVSSLQQGLYFVKITHGDKVYSEKLIVN